MLGLRSPGDGLMLRWRAASAPPLFAETLVVRSPTMRRLSACAAAAAMILVVGAAACFAAEPAQSEWVYPGADGKLAYKTTPAGDRVMDFSHAGYRGGGVSLPRIPVTRDVKPSGGDDDAAAIQAAINDVSALPLENGFRGAVLLAPGVFRCGRT